jgi:hypothetical protein
MQATVLTCRDPFSPGRRTQRAVHRRRRIRALAPRTGLPVIAYHNGRVILRAEWRRRVVDGDVIAFVVLPLGGGGEGGKNPLQLVAALALMYFAPGIGSSIYSAMGGTFVAAEAGLVISGISAAVSIAGNALISSAFAGRPSLPTPQQAGGVAGFAAPSPTYNLQAQGNMARLDAAIPVQYGRMMSYPDFAAQPYAEFAGNEQYLFQLLCLGQGYFEVEAIRIEDTAISVFPEIDYEIIEPGGTLTLFPSSVVTSSEVSGQEAVYDTWLGPFVANAAGTSANTLAVDVVCPRGLFYANDSGGLSVTTLTFTAEARTIDSGGTPTGSYATLGTETLSAGTNTPQRYSFRYIVTGARYEVRLKRTTTAGGTTRYGDDLNWAGLRAYLPETRTWAGQTVIALRMRASNNLSGHASRKINVIATRKLPIYSAGVWTAPQVTRSPAWAMADTLRASYGGGLSDARIDIDQLITLAATYAARGDCFDGRFDSTLTLWEAVSKIGQAVRTKPYIQGGIVHFVRDEAASVPVALFSMRNIVRGSFSVDYLMPTDDTADALDVGYFDSSVWSPRRVIASLPGSAEAKPLKAELFGVTGRQQAYQEGMYLAAVNHYRRKRITFATEMEGFIPSFGDLIAISHDMPAWGTGGEVTAYNAGTKVISLSEPVTFVSGTYYIGLRKRDGSISGPYVVTAGADSYKVVHTAATLDATPYTGGAEERTHFAFGAGETWRQPARVVSVKPSGLNRVAIEAINEDDSVHTADSGVTAPAAQYSSLISLYTAPVVAGLTARSQVDDPTVILVSWQAAPGARFYIVDVSSDGDVWTRVGETTGNNTTIAAVYGNGTLIRVAAFGFTLGPAVQIAYATYSDYMWAVPDTGLMWSATSTDLMWSA